MHYLRGTVAGLLVLIAVAHANVHAAPRAGVAAAVRGSVTLDRVGAVGEAVQTGAPIFIGDEIETGPDSGLQILLLDETVFTLGPNSAMLIDEFVFDPSAKRGKLDAELVRGTFRFISGRIAKQSPDKMKVKLPSGTIGIRGTVVNVQIDPSQGRSLVLLAGPGADNTAGVSEGHISVENGGVTRDVTRSGWGVEIPDSGSPPSDPLPFPPALLDGFAFETPGASGGGTPNPQGGSQPQSGAGTPGDGEETSDAGSAPDSESSTPGGDTAPPPPSGAPLLVAGTSLATGREGAAIDQQFDSSLSTFGQLTEASAQTALMDSLDASEDMMDAMNVVTSVADLAVITSMFSGQFEFILMDLPFESGGGNLDLFVNLDFVNQVVAFQVRNVNSSMLGLFETEPPGQGGMTSVPFSQGIGGNASFIANFAYVDTLSSSCEGGCPTTVTADFMNQGIELASRLKTSVTLREGQGMIEERTVPTEVSVTSRSGEIVQTP